MSAQVRVMCKGKQLQCQLSGTWHSVSCLSAFALHLLIESNQRGEVDLAVGQGHALSTSFAVSANGPEFLTQERSGWFACHVKSCWLFLSCFALLSSQNEHRGRLSSCHATRTARKNTISLGLLLVRFAWAAPLCSLVPCTHVSFAPPVVLLAALPGRGLNKEKVPQQEFSGGGSMDEKCQREPRACPPPWRPLFSPLRGISRGCVKPSDQMPLASLVDDWLKTNVLTPVPPPLGGPSQRVTAKAA